MVYIKGFSVLGKKEKIESVPLLLNNYIMSNGYKFTDSFFSFPIKIYDKESIEGYLKVDDILGDRGTEPDWIVGIMKIPAQWFVDDKVSWLDGYTRGRSLEEINREGFDITQVDVDGDIYTCAWERRKFEEKLNEFMEKYSNSIMKQIKEEEVGDE